MNPVVFHFDGKSVSAQTNGLSKKEDRLGVIINIDGNFYLSGIPAMDNGCAISQINEIKNLLEDFKVEMKIDLVTFEAWLLIQ